MRPVERGVHSNSLTPGGSISGDMASSAKVASGSTRRMRASVVQPFCFCSRDHSALYAALSGSVAHEARQPAIVIETYHGPGARYQCLQPEAERRRVLADFMSDRAHVVVATCAEPAESAYARAPTVSVNNVVTDSSMDAISPRDFFVFSQW